LLLEAKFGIGAGEAQLDRDSRQLAVRHDRRQLIAHGRLVRGPHRRDESGAHGNRGQKSRKHDSPRLP
jgi:hypothetical protein